uniref:Glucokinase n=1 Tax=uncultured bacterium B19D1_C12D4_E9D6 TaxID=1329637 RepID=S4W9U8_9BACT|nr:glucokinase [uncultured bacterium B19D1_C12D4_E9D6]
MARKEILIADIGATNVRFALLEPLSYAFSELRTGSTRDFSCAEDAIDWYLQEVSTSILEAICIAAAGPVIDQCVCFTNNHWKLNAVNIKKTTGVKQVQLLNDFEAVAYGLPCLEQGDLLSVGGDWSINDCRDFTVAVIGPGSGLGVGGLCVRNGQRFPLIGEGGHVGFAPANELQIALLDALMSKFERVSAERLLSGPGIQNIYVAICSLNGTTAETLSPAQIMHRAESERDENCEQAVALFFEILGQITGDLALTMGARAGVYIGGGIVQKSVDEFLASKFREGFNSKGRHRDLLEKTPTWLITHQNAGLVGASFYAREYLSQRS